MAIKFANTEKEAIAQLKTVSKKNRVEFTNINVKEV